MTDQTRIPVPAQVAADAHMDAEAFARTVESAARDPQGFWCGVGERLDW